jgi:large conductance mechanosensitive channel
MFKEFKQFALGGNMIDLAIGLVVGSASSNIIVSLVKGIFVPRVRAMTSGGDPTKLPPVDMDSVISSIVSFLILMLIVFVIVKIVNRLKKGQEPEPVEKECPYCRFSIPIEATRCGRCTSQLEGAMTDGSARITSAI